MYLIVIEAESNLGGAMPPPVYHYQPYRLAKTVEEAKDFMRDYMRRDGDDPLTLVPHYFAVYKEMDGEFGTPRYFDPCTPELEEADATEWLVQTGRC